MKHFLSSFLVLLLGASFSMAEPRTFTNTEGQTVEAELVAVRDGAAVLQLANRSIAKVPLTSLSEADQTFVKEWWEKNKNKLDPMDFKLEIDKNTERIDRKVTKSGGGGGNKNKSPVTKKMQKDEISYSCELESYAQRDISDIAVNYTIYKRVSTRDKEGSETTTEEIEGETNIRLLEAKGSTTFETDTVPCEDSSQTGGNQPRTYKRETVIGLVVRLSVGGEQFLEESYPENFLDRLKEEEEREEERAEDED
ncbi:hypothetical protein HAHE_19140 [Haloferula helveola]|uniref:SLA1 homology domain-containing protein n=1 Tax=Haloferula helveola TaxID=490095 RepID=A0ABN6H340_9BACT|nr:hypothetical protein HAHE_19140 [Haloferula helveola]